MIRHSRPALAVIAAWIAVSPATALAQTRPAPRPWGRISFYFSTYRFTPDTGEERTASEMITAVTYQTAERFEPGLEYALEARHATQTTAGRDPRISVYNAWVGGSIAGGTIHVRGGQMWLPELGGLGSVSGGLIEARQITPGQAGRLRAAAFFGVEPQTHAVGFVPNVTKFGVYATLEGSRGRRHVAGFVQLTQRGVPERRVLAFSNFVPTGGRLFIYQVGEYDLSGPAGQGAGRLSFLLVNGRLQASDRVEVQGSFHRGRSLDARSITDDILNGRPVDAATAEGYFYESLGGRVTVALANRSRAYAGYTRDRNNRDSAPTGRQLYGFSSTDVAGSGIDATLSASRIERPTGGYHSLYASVGRQLGRRVYVSIDYTSSLSIVRFTRQDGVTVETRPETKRLGGSTVLTLGRHVTVQGMIEQTRDADSREWRVMSGITYRFR